MPFLIGQFEQRMRYLTKRIGFTYDIKKAWHFDTKEAAQKYAHSYDAIVEVPNPVAQTTQSAVSQVAQPANPTEAK